MTRQTQAPSGGIGLSERAAADLRWFFRDGISQFERSVSGAMLDRLREESATSSGERIPSPSQMADRVWAYKQRECRSRVELRRRTGKRDPEREALLEAIRELMEAEWADHVELPDCDPTVTARPVHSGQSEEQGYEPDDVALQRYARVSRALSLCPRSCAVALAEYYGPVGSRYAEHPLERILTLYPLTAAGRDLSERTGDGETALERILAVWNTRNLGKSSPEVRGLFLTARCEAIELLQVALRAFRAAWGGQ